ncbi:MAG: DUF6265 family protein [Acidobacteriota bacterium]|nr:DUF6265 family protein [Acidobacteriota bacterium]
MRSTVIAAIFIVLGLAAVPATQSAATFPGTWIATTEAPQGIAAAPSAVFGARFAIAQDGASVTLTRLGRDGAFALKLPLDGSSVRWRVPARVCEADTERIESVAMEAGALAYTLVGTVPGGGGEPRMANARFLMRPDGSDRLVVQGSMVQQGERRAVATVYARSTEAIPVMPAQAPFTGPAASIAQAAWVGGTWTGAAGTSTVEERWTPAASGSMLAISRTLGGPQMAGFEFLCIVERDGTLVYTAMPGARTPPTYFTLTSATEDSLTFENPAHDYPKLVRYTRLADGSLQTTISAGGEVRAQSVVLRKN